MKPDIIEQKSFTQIVKLIQQSKQRAYASVNKELIDLYWNIGKFINKKIESDGWGKGTVVKLAIYIQKELIGVRGFSSENLWRMKKFYETYRPFAKLSPLVREFGKSAMSEKLSPLVTDFKKPLEYQINEVFKDNYVFEFLDLPKDFKERDLRKALVKNLREFILELGKGFSFIGEEYRLQVGNKDFFIDLLFYHRGLQCLVAIDLKIDDFCPEYLGKMNFYLEVLDKKQRLDHENPSVGLLLCKTKDDEIVNYAMNRNLSPTKVAEYETKLIDKEILKKKLHELGEYYLLPRKHKVRKNKN